MSLRPLGCLLALLLWAAPGAAPAQVVPERELDVVRALFNAGNYQDALTRARQAMALANFSEPQRIELLKLAGLAALNTADPAGAEQFFYQLLQLNPDYVLDPFAVPPPAIRAFEEVRKKNGDALNLVRQNIALREERAKRDAEERERKRVEEEERRRRLDALSRTQKVVTEKPFAVNFLPFGAGQFQQGRLGWGVAFATTEGALAATSIVAFFAIESLFENTTLSYDNRLYPEDGKFEVTIRRIPESRRTERDVWSAVKLASGISFYVLWAAGVVDAILHHQEKVVTEVQLPAEPAPAEGPAGDRLRTSRQDGARLTPYLFPAPQGLGAGVDVRF